MSADLTAIMTKVRRLTRTPSSAQLSDADLIEYINTFTVYDFPEQLRTFNLRDTFSWTCNPFQDEYPIDVVGGAGNQLNNFKNLYISIHPPLYIAGFQQMYTQSREQFFGIYPQVRSIASIGVFGDGVTTQFTGTINANQAIIAPGQVTNASLLQRKVLFSSLDSNGLSLAMVDVPLVDPITLQFLPNGNLFPSDAFPTNVLQYPTVIDPTNTINYVTGQFTVTFATAPANMAPINSQTVPTALGIPQSMLFYDNLFTLRPVPDQPYTINFEVYRRPFSLDTNLNPNPELEEYWQLISYGAARKILQDRVDIDTLPILEPEFREQMRLCLRRNIVQYTNERTATIYTEQTQFGIQNNGFGFGGGQF